MMDRCFCFYCVLSHDFTKGDWRPDEDAITTINGTCVCYKHAKEVDKRAKEVAEKMFEVREERA